MRREMYVQFWWRNSAGNRQLGRPRRRWIILKWFLRETGLDGADWIHVSENIDGSCAVVNAVMDFRGSIKCGEYFG
jgi:hypothetical protein